MCDALRGALLPWPASSAMLFRNQADGEGMAVFNLRFRDGIFEADGTFMGGNCRRRLTPANVRGSRLAPKIRFVLVILTNSFDLPEIRKNRRTTRGHE